ncbi:MAG: formate dehydrogenase accessory sulfurtransferase FdhD [Chitinophagaceae bacterium]|nr:formate dehydrogenase accessory sulfurtransferase FdhD [Chitinophagaceae bacterium]
MRSSSVAAVQILKVTSPGSDKNSFVSDQAEDMLAVEQPLEIKILYGTEDNRHLKNISVTMCTPGHDEELATGFLFTEGIIKSSDDIISCVSTAAAGNNSVTTVLKPGITFDPKKMERHFYTSSSCGVCGKSSIDAVKNNFSGDPLHDTMSIPAFLLIQLPELLRKQQEVFEHTGGLHASALFDPNGHLLLSREDVGRHNALDKLIGASLIAGNIPLHEHLLLLSGRASFELIQKAAMAGIKIVCAVGAPSSLAVELAKELDITLVGFLRDGRFNIYSGEQRIHK